MASLFDYEQKKRAILPNPMSIDKSVVRTTLLPSLLNVYEYNKGRKVKNVMLYEIAKTYDKDYQEESKISILMNGDYLENKWQGSKKVDFYILKGLIENLMDYLGLQNRYQFECGTIPNMHPGISCKIILDREQIGIMGRVHPKTCKDEVYICELSLNALMKKIKPLKYKEASKYPEINKDLAFVVKKEVPASQIEAIIKKVGGRLLQKIEVFDVYEGENVEKDEKSLAFNLTFMDPNKTLTDEEVMTIFNQMIEKVEFTLDAKLRNE